MCELLETDSDILELDVEVSPTRSPSDCVLLDS